MKFPVARRMDRCYKNRGVRASFTGVLNDSLVHLRLWDCRCHHLQVKQSYSASYSCSPPRRGLRPRPPSLSTLCTKSKNEASYALDIVKTLYRFLSVQITAQSVTLLICATLLSRRSVSNLE